MRDSRSLSILCAVTAIDMLGYGIIVPILPFYAEGMGASAIELSIVVAAFPLAQTISFPLSGRLSDRFGRPRLILLGLVISAVSYVAFGFANSLLALLLSRIGAGFGAGTFPVIQAFAADISEDKDRTAAMGYIGASYGVGLMLGPALASLTSVFGYAVTGLVAAFLSVAGAVLARLYLPRPRERRSDPSAYPSLTMTAWLRAYGARPLSIVLVIYLLALMAFEGMMSMLALFLERKISLGIQEAGLLWAWGGLVTIVSRLGIGRWAARLEDKAIVLGGLALLLCGIVLLAMTLNFWYALLAILPFSAGYGLLFPTLSSLASKHASEALRGAILGGFLLLGGSVRVFGPILAGYGFERISIHFPLLVAAVIFIFAAAVALVIPKSTRLSSQA